MDGKPQRERAASLYALGHPQNLNDVKQAAAHEEDLGSRCLISCTVRVLFFTKTRENDALLAQTIVLT